MALVNRCSDTGWENPENSHQEEKRWSLPVTKLKEQNKMLRKELVTG